MRTLIGGLILCVLTACHSVPAMAQNVQMMLMPGTDHVVAMPSNKLIAFIEQDIRDGTAPGYILLSGPELQEACGVKVWLYGCTLTVMQFSVIYIRDGLSKQQFHMTLVHEIAHDKYKWRHQ